MVPAATGCSRTPCIRPSAIFCISPLPASLAPSWKPSDASQASLTVATDSPTASIFILCLSSIFRKTLGRAVFSYASSSRRRVAGVSALAA